MTGRVPSFAQTNVDPPAVEDIDAGTDIRVTPPTNTMQGLRGLSQTNSAEALGEGRLILGLNAPWYRQERAFPGAPNEDADIFTAIGTLAYGISPQWDIFGSLTAYGTQNYVGSDASGLGTVGGGIQATLPLGPSSPLRLAAQAAVFNGISDNPIDSNFGGGYSYFETRTGLDFHGSLIQTLLMGTEAVAMKLHFNEGVVTSFESGVDPLMLLATGLQVNVPFAALGLELHSRTKLNDVNFQEDPLWITPSVQFRTRYNINLMAGSDIALSDERGPGPIPAARSLEPYRLFGGVAFTLDTQAEKRRQAKLKAFSAARERELLRARNQELAMKSRQDSLNALNANEEAAALMAKASQDSLARIEQSRQDSLALADANRRLQQERASRSDLENQLLSTGLLVMDAVYFETGKADISINSKPYLNMLAKMLTKYPKLQIEVGGHTDNVGSEAYNQNLSQNRAAAVMSYMTSQVPELASRLTARGYGESMAKADNTTAEGRKMNRRTELQVLNKDVLQEYNRPIQTSGTAPAPTDNRGGSNMGGSGSQGGTGTMDSTRQNHNRPRTDRNAPADTSHADW
jgi:outer membrane protein OmpA-like peptidoglycan-associated protein